MNELLEKLLGKGSAQYCSGCSQLVEKNGGCNHMTCRCGRQWCWKCGKGYGKGKGAVCADTRCRDPSI